MASELITHDGTVKTKELSSPGYVWFKCARWGVNDNTTGQIGWHVEYRPLAAGYKRGCEITDAMRLAVEEHYAEQQAIEQRAEDERKARFDREHEAAMQAAPLPANVARLVNRYGSSEKAWESEDEGAWAALRQHGY